MPSYNKTSILLKMTQATTNSQRIENFAYGLTSKRVEQQKKELINKFNNHEVTREIERGNQANSSFLSDGNLFAFIGFHDNGEEEIQFNEVRNLLEQQTRLIKKPIQKIVNRSSVTMRFNVRTPFLKDIWAKTPYPKTPPGNVDRSGSWADDIETKGIDGFMYFLYLFSYDKPPSDKSRSGPGLQVRKKIHSGGDLKGVPYIRELLNEFESALGSKR